MCVREPQQQTSRGWKLRLQDMEGLELHVSMSEEGDTAKKKKKAVVKETILTDCKETKKAFLWAVQAGALRFLSLL